MIRFYEGLIQIYALSCYLVRNEVKTKCSFQKYAGQTSKRKYTYLDLFRSSDLLKYTLVIGFGV